MKKLIVISIIAALLGITCAAYANNIAVSDVSIASKDTGTDTVSIKFTLTQDNVFAGTDGNSQRFYDCAWIFVKYWVEGVNNETTGWSHAMLASGGTLAPTADGLGAYAQVGSNQTITWNYGANPANPVTDVQITTSGTVKVRVMAIEMVYIPEGRFIYGYGSANDTTFNNFATNVAADSQPNVTRSATDVTDSLSRPANTPLGWPNGFDDFYVMKYEVSQGQYADFLNMSPEPVLGAYPATSGSRCSLTYDANPLTAYGSRYAVTPARDVNRAMNYIAWGDFKAYASWCGLRPPTEMEFEKAARGGGAAANMKFTWGANTLVSTTYVFDGATMNKLYGYAGAAGTSPGPIADVGLFLSGNVARTPAETGAPVYGIADLVASNTREAVIRCDWMQVPLNGNGTISPPESWPVDSGRSWRCGASEMPYISLRYSMGDVTTTRGATTGARFVRSAE